MCSVVAGVCAAGRQVCVKACFREEAWLQMSVPSSLMSPSPWRQRQGFGRGERRAGRHTVFPGRQSLPFHSQPPAPSK